MKINQKKIYFWIKAWISLGLMSFLLIKFDFNIFIERFLLLNPWWFLLFFLLPHVNIILSAWKWQILLRCNNVDENLVSLVKLYFVGTFFNNFFPTMAGGDIVRISQLAMKNGKTASIVAATYIERLSGVTALLIFLIVIQFDRELIEKAPFIQVGVGAFILCYLLIMIVSFNTRIFIWLTKKGQGKIWGKFFLKIENIQKSVFHYRSKGVILGQALAISIVFYFLACVSVYFAGKALLLEMPLGSVFVVVPLVILVGMLPVTLNGLGLNESSYVFFFTLFGISAPMALSIAILLRFRILFSAMLGGLLFVCGRAERQVTCGSSD